MKTPAVVFTSPGEGEVQEISMPLPGPGEVQIRTDFSCISSGTEGWVLHNRFTWAPTTYPSVPGYQRTGIVTEIGQDVEGWLEGDSVMSTSGSWHSSPVPFWGSHAAIANSKAESLFRIPNGVDPLAASGTVVAQVGYNAAYRPQIEPGDWVIVYGDGLIGQFGAQAARSRGARTILVGHREERLEVARTQSSDHAIQENDLTVEEIRAITGSEYVPIIIDTVQKPECQEAYLPLLEQGKGQIVYSGFSPEEPWASMTQLHKKELTTHYIQA
jgi:2-desacetyl-2-hydroxyethyl bacteriochlorophyllide A dehydrogenase